jgi:hypothetical protein
MASNEKQGSPNTARALEYGRAAKTAVQLILQNQHLPSLNYAINYAHASLLMDESAREFQVQCLYIANNITHWRKHKDSAATPDEIKAARAAIKACGQLANSK